MFSQWTARHWIIAALTGITSGCTWLFFHDPNYEWVKPVSLGIGVFITALLPSIGRRPNLPPGAPPLE